MSQLDALAARWLEQARLLREYQLTPRQASEAATLEDCAYQLKRAAADAKQTLLLKIIPDLEAVRRERSPGASLAMREHPGGGDAPLPAGVPVPVPPGAQGPDGPDGGPDGPAEPLAAAGAPEAAPGALPDSGWEALAWIAGGTARAQAMMRRNGFVIDKWPILDRPPGPWTPEQLAALDPEVLWQGVAFTLYTDLVELSQRAQHALEDDE